MFFNCLKGKSQIKRFLLYGVLLALVLFLMAGCRSIQENEAIVFVPEDLQTNARLPFWISLYAIDGNTGFTHPYLIEGPHVLTVYVVWSNGYGEHVPLALNAVAGSRYSIWAVELKPDQNPQSVYVRPSTWGEEMGAGFIEYPIAVVASPFFFAHVFGVLLFPPTDKPFENCCYIWIEEAQTGEVVSGRKPN